MNSPSEVSRRSFFNGIIGGSAALATTLTQVKTAFAQQVQGSGLGFDTLDLNLATERHAGRAKLDRYRTLVVLGIDSLGDPGPSMQPATRSMSCNKTQAVSAEAGMATR